MTAEGATVRAYDPVAMPKARETARPGVIYCSDEIEAVEGPDGIVVATEWNQFRGIDPDLLKSRLRGRVVCDLRNVYEPSVMRSKGFDYVAVGR